MEASNGIGGSLVPGRMYVRISPTVALSRAHWHVQAADSRIAPGLNLSQLRTARAQTLDAVCGMPRSLVVCSVRGVPDGATSRAAASFLSKRRSGAAYKAGFAKSGLGRRSRQHALQCVSLGGAYGLRLVYGVGPCLSCHESTRARRTSSVAHARGAIVVFVHDGRALDPATSLTW